MVLISVPLAVVGLLGLITLTTGAVLLAPYIRDTVTGEIKEVELEKQDTIQKILDDPNMTDEQKFALIAKIIGEEDWMHDIMIILVIAIIAYAIISVSKK